MLAPRIALERGILVAYTYSHIGIRCEYHESQRPGFLEYPVSALDQFGARIVSGEKKGCSESDVIVMNDSFTTQIHAERSTNHICCTLSRRTDS